MATLRNSIGSGVSPKGGYLRCKWSNSSTEKKTTRGYLQDYPIIGPRASESQPNGRGNIRTRLREAEKEDPAAEYRFSLSDPWSRRLLIALLRRYGIEPYRYHGQRRTTVMAKVSQKFVEETLWPEFEAFQATLSDYFDEFTSRVIMEVLEEDPRDAEQR